MSRFGDFCYIYLYLKTNRMKIQELEDGDDVVLKFLGETIIEVYEDEDVELHAPVDELFKTGDQISVTVCSVDEHSLGVQFGDGSVSFLHPTSVEFIRFS